MNAKTILIVEDDPAVRALLVAYLQSLGQVRAVGDAESALTVIAQRAPDLVCVDLTLPQASGFELCRAVRQMSGALHTRLLVASGRTTMADRAQARECGADAFVDKPLRRTTVLRMAQTLLSAAAAQPTLSLINPVVLPVAIAGKPAGWTGAAMTTLSPAAQTVMAHDGRDNPVFTNKSDAVSMGAHEGANEVARD